MSAVDTTRREAVVDALMAEVVAKYGPEGPPPEVIAEVQAEMVAKGFLALQVIEVAAATREAARLALEARTERDRAARRRSQIERTRRIAKRSRGRGGRRG